MDNIDVPLAFKLWDVANTIVLISIANTLAFLYKCFDKDYADNLRTKKSTFYITMAVNLLGLFVFCCVIVGAHIGYSSLFECQGQEPSKNVWDWATAFRLIIVVGLGVICIIATLVMRRKTRGGSTGH